MVYGFELHCTHGATGTQSRGSQACPGNQRRHPQERTFHRNKRLIPLPLDMPLTTPAFISCFPLRVSGPFTCRLGNVAPVALLVPVHSVCSSPPPVPVSLKQHFLTCSQCGLQGSEDPSREGKLMCGCLCLGGGFWAFIRFPKRSIIQKC